MMRKRKKSGCLYALLALLTSMLVVCLGLMACAFFIFQGEDVKEQVMDQFAEKEKIPFQQIENVQENIARKYYYEQLYQEEQTVYLEILQGIQENNAQIYVHSSDAKRTNLLFQYVLRDYPEIFWCDGTTTATSYGGDEEYTVLEPVYLYDAEERDERQGQIDAASAECLAGIKADASDYEKILYVYEYIVDTVEYDLDAEDNQNICSVFVGRRSVCAGYSKATQYLLEQMGIFCTYVTGKTESGQSHAWNLVLCGGDYYYVDTTWGDPVFQEQEGEEVKKNLDYISYDYMCCDDEELLRTHIPDADLKLPECTKMDCNYYVVNGMYYDHYDSGEAMAVMNNMISKKGSPVVFKFSNEDLYEEAHKDIFENVIHEAAQSLAQMYGLSQVKYSYIDDKKLNKIVIYWEYEE
ncbi:transglutaminase domain-containing protein [Lachnospiraceae bacterium 48-42]